MDSDDGDRSVAIRRLNMLVVGVLLAGAAALFLMGDDQTWRGQTITAVTAWAATSLALFSGVRLGAQGGNANAAVTLLVVIVGVGAMLIPPPYRFALLAASFAAQGAWEAYGSAEAGVRAANSRMWTTFMAVAALVLALVATAGQPG